MLELALENEASAPAVDFRAATDSVVCPQAEGDVLLHDAGQGFHFRPGLHYVIHAQRQSMGAGLFTLSQTTKSRFI